MKVEIIDIFQTRFGTILEIDKPSKYSENDIIETKVGRFKIIRQMPITKPPSNEHIFLLAEKI